MNRKIKTNYQLIFPQNKSENSVFLYSELNLINISTLIIVLINYVDGLDGTKY